MRRPLRSVLAVCALGLLVAVVVACGSSGREMRAPTEGAVSPTRSTASTTTTASILPLDQLSLSSPAFASGQPIPAEYSCTGPSPALAWSGIPADTKELALVVTDPTGQDFVHWAVTGISPTPGSIAKGEVPPGATQLPNSSGKIGWVGPCPPAGATHTYNFMLLALPEPSALPPGTPTKDVVAKLQDKAKGRIVILSGTFNLAGGSAGSAGPNGTGTAGSAGSASVGSAKATTTVTR